MYLHMCDLSFVSNRACPSQPSTPDGLGKHAIPCDQSGRVAVIPELPPGVAVALSRFFPVFDKALSVQPTTRLKGAPQSIFTPAEDALLALGIRRYGLQWPRIQQVLLPAKTVQQVIVFSDPWHVLVSISIAAYLLANNSAGS